MIEKLQFLGIVPNELVQQFLIIAFSTSIQRQVHSNVESQKFSWIQCFEDKFKVSYYKPPFRHITGRKSKSHLKMYVPEQTHFQLYNLSAAINNPCSFLSIMITQAINYSGRRSVPIPR